MSKTEEFIIDSTKNYSNEKRIAVGKSIHWEKQPWLTPNEARKAVEIAREETLQEVKEKLLIMLNTSIDNKHFFEQLDDYIEELETSNEK